MARARGILWSWDILWPGVLGGILWPRHRSILWPGLGYSMGMARGILWPGVF